ncbi:oxygenase MpaB family protein [Corynebacterium pelargi]|uniref:ER-bound oxygenase mpaB/mpaB'/Rubber oxygenase catalytic domain-containing protein n=1 Tax=Corynebacterium pelargi TaxID=1471400 RepID=A0A410W7N7_9CORY|nr:oxygenase MpaB family protein [Corynebacterium pelargi]QAU51967.1 hypothetical protein CPELA_03440 [Corynebacterium pelargi]GGG71100.1 hypothetical protein GCM10007338_05110 [Corynebacterium pelargi]
MNQPNTWPPKRGSQQEFAKAHGEELAQRYQEAFWAMDPVADAIFASDHSVREIMPNLREALQRGHADENTFPEVAALIDDMKKALEGIDEEQLERGRRVYLSIPPLAHGIALGPGSLVHTYSTPSIADVLVNTGELTVGAVKRLAYTTNWTYSLYLTDGLQPGGLGFYHTGMVRAMHAHVRRVHNKRGFDYSDWGSPINEFDMLRTWLDFTIIPYAGLEKMGWKLSQEEQRDAFYLWKVVGRMVGIPSDLIEPLDDIESTQPYLDAVHEIDGEPNENSQALVDALMHGFVVNAHAITGLPEDSLKEWTEAHVRIIHGDGPAEAYGIATTNMQPILEMSVPTVQQRFDLLRANQEALDEEIKNNEQMLKDLLDPEASYLKQDDGVKTASTAS